MKKILLYRVEVIKRKCLMVSDCPGARVIAEAIETIIKNELPLR